MKADPRIAVLVPARGGSKGIPRKNLQLLGMESLLGWAIAIGKKIPGSMGTFVSTDDAEIAAEGERCGANILHRPPEIAQDTSTVTQMIDHHLMEWEAEGRFPDAIVYLEPTSPFRTVEEVERCITTLCTTGADSVATFRSLSFHPTWLLSREDDGSMSRLDIAHELWNAATGGEPVFALSGEVYVFDTRAYRRLAPSGIYFGNAWHVIKEGPSIDIDTPFDLATARRLVSEQTDVLGLDPVLQAFAN